MPFQAFAGDTDDVTVAVGSEENDPGLPSQFVGDGTQTYVAAPIPTSPGQQAEPTLAQIPRSAVSVTTQAELQNALDAGIEEITVANAISLVSPLTIANTGVYNVTIKADDSTLLTAASAQRHFLIGAGAALHLSFSNIVLEGDNKGGGISSTGTVTINNPVIKNCFISDGTEGGGIYANGSTRVEGGSITGCKALRGGGIMCAPGKTLTVLDATLQNNQARHTSAADSGVGGGIGVGTQGSLVASNCTISGNSTTGDGANHKGLGGGVGAWIGTYTELTNCTITNNISYNFAGGVLSHWNSNLVINGGLISGNDVSASPTFGSGGGICVAGGSTMQLMGGLVIADNLAQYGAGVRLEFSMIASVASTVSFTGNHSYMSGGVFSCGGSTNEGYSLFQIAAASFSGNSARSGGAIYMGRGYELICTGTQFTQNTAESSGGVLYALPEGRVNINAADLSGNTATYGGAIYMNSSANLATTTPLVIVNSTVNNNRVDTTNVMGQAGAILIGNYCTLSMTNTQVNGNTGGYGGALAVFSNCILTIAGDSTVNGNTAASSGGGIYLVSNTSATITDSSQISGNRTSVNGGGIYLSSGSTLELSDTASISGNTATEFGGGIAGARSNAITVGGAASVSDNTAGEYGGGIYAHTGDTAGTFTAITLKDTASITGNSAAYGGGISAAYPDQDAYVPTVTLSGGTFSDNIATYDGGGIWTPVLAKASIAAGVTLSGNKAEQAYYMSDTSPDVAIHTANIHIGSFSVPPPGAPAFAYAYNNYDIVYKAGATLVTATFDAQGGAPPLQSVSTFAGSALGSAMAADPTYPGHAFLGWYTLPDGGGASFDSTTPVIADITLYAFWESIPPVTVTFDAQGGVPAIQTVTVQRGASLGTAIAPAPTYDSYAFLGWYSQPNGGGTLFDSATVVDSDMIVYAFWEAVPPGEVIVTFDAMGGRPAIQTVATKSGLALGYSMPPEPDYDGHSFVEWNILPDGSSSSFDGDTVVDDNITVYAVWLSSYDGVTVTFDAQGGTPSIQRVAAERGTSLGYSMPEDPFYRGHEFIEWNTLPGGGAAAFDATSLVNGDITVYAIWRSSGGGSSSSSSSSGSSADQVDQSPSFQVIETPEIPTSPPSGEESDEENVNHNPDTGGFSRTISPSPSSSPSGSRWQNLGVAGFLAGVIILLQAVRKSRKTHAKRW